MVFCKSILLWQAEDRNGCLTEREWLNRKGRIRAKGRKGVAETQIKKLFKESNQQCCGWYQIAIRRRTWKQWRYSTQYKSLLLALPGSLMVLTMSGTLEQISSSPIQISFLTLSWNTNRHEVVHKDAPDGWTLLLTSMLVKLVHLNYALPAMQLLHWLPW